MRKGGHMSVDQRQASRDFMLGFWDSAERTEMVSASMKAAWRHFKGEDREKYERLRQRLVDAAKENGYFPGSS